MIMWVAMAMAMAIPYEQIDNDVRVWMAMT